MESCIIIDGKTSVIAGAGSGKTRTLTYRTSYLLENEIGAEHILILTFTKKSAEEIKRRVSNLLGNNIANQVTSGTFYSFCNIFLIKYYKVLGISPKFSILDQGDSQDLLSLLQKQEKIVKKEDIPFPSKAVLQSIISTSCNKVISIVKIVNQDYQSYKSYLPEICQLDTIYQQYKRDGHLYDYNDLIDQINVHLESNAQFKASVQKKYNYIMVDEYQDTNIPQKKLIDLLAEKEDFSLMVVGDDNQSIYAFRGANYENILRFGEVYQNAKLIKLEQNYRSTPNILNFINDISAKISSGYRKNYFLKKIIWVINMY